MAAKFVSERNIKFLLYEVFDVESLTEYEYYSEHNRKMFDMVLKAAIKLGKDLLFPIFEEFDRIICQQGIVRHLRTPNAFR